jgi:hypothetical protein
VTSLRTGTWSDATLWSSGHVPLRSETVVVAPGHQVTYDVFSDVEIGSVTIQGTLIFARDRFTRLDVGNVIVSSGGYLQVGTAADPIPATAHAEIRLVTSASSSCTGGSAFVAGDIGIWVFAGGKWDSYGAPLRATWAKLTETATVGASLLKVAGDVSDWPVGATLVVTPTDLGARTNDQVLTYPQYEEFPVSSVTLRTG